MQLDLLTKLRQVNPIVVNVSNFITAVDVANALNSLGASPIMTEASQETEAMADLASAVCLNMGAFTTTQVTEIQRLGEFANQKHKPLVFDPVAVGALPVRTQVAKDLFTKFKPDIIRGNAGEIAALADFAWNSKGIDAGNGNGDRGEIAVRCARKYHCVVILSGKTDIITDGQQITTISNGTPLFQLHVGSGDMLSSIVAAFAAVAEGAFYEAAVAACAIFAATGQLVAAKLDAERPATFAIDLIDELHLIQTDQLKEVLNYAEADR